MRGVKPDSASGVCPFIVEVAYLSALQVSAVVCVVEWNFEEILRQRSN